MSDNNNERINPKQEWFKLSCKKANILYWYLGIFLSLALIGAIALIILNFEIVQWIGVEKTAMISCIIFPAMGSCIFYIRKLYKACINLDIVPPVDSFDNMRQRGIVFYFILRPIFAIGFGILLYLSFKIGINSMIKSPQMEAGFIYFCMFFSFFVGYSSGDVIDKLEHVGKKIVDNSFTYSTKE